MAEQLLKSREWNCRGSHCICNTLLLSPDSPWQVSGSSREEKGDDRGRWYRRCGQDVEWGMETEVLMPLTFLNTLAHLCARFIGWFGFFDLCLFFSKLFCSKGLTQ